MTPSLPPVPGQPPSPPPPPGGMSGLVPPPAPVAPGPNQAVAAYMEQIRNLHMQIDALANQHPEAAESLNKAKLALADSMSAVATNSGSPDGGPAPQSF
jgi:hypothetical protein